MVHTVGILGANGLIGGQALPHLVKAQAENKIKLVVLTRPGSKVKNLDANAADVREVNLEDGADLDKALKGINVLLTAITLTNLPVINNVVDALKRSKDAVTFIPSAFGPLFSQDEYNRYPGLEQLGSLLGGAIGRAKEQGVGTTVVLSGSFDPYFFNYKLVNVDIKANKVEANEAQLKNPYPITNTDDLGKCLAELTLRDPESIKNQNYSVVSHWVTGNGFIDLFTRINGSKPEVVPYDEAAEKALAGAAPYGPLAAGYKRHWEQGPESFGYESPLKVTGGRSLEQTARDALKNM